MDAEDKAVLGRIADGVDRLVAAIPKPESKAMKVLGVVATVAGAAGLLGAVQIILDWIGR
ncbi:hypothetical protein FACS1894142_5940 [Spirochaetia bacterium]|nr:hypothetical protein FACS1894142_5940 [Spirochaetia bacterium]